MEDHIQLRPEGTSAAEARRFVREFLSGSDVSVDRDVAELLVSETVTNALLHARGAVSVYVAVVPGGLRVEVHDTSGRLPVRRQHGPEAATGRGLELVDTLADEWGAYLLESSGETRKVVWFRVRTSVAGQEANGAA